MRTLLSWFLFILLVLAGLAFVSWQTVGQVYAHEWFSGKRNPGTNENCCNSVDCRIIGNDDWWMEGGSIKVKWSDGRTYSMPAIQAQPTEDPLGRPAACVLAGRLRCAFIPLGS